MTSLSLLLALVVGTWNGNWFPSGRAEHRAHPAVEAATITAAAKMLSAGLHAVDPEGTNEVILCLNEMRGPRTVTNLIAQIGRPNLRLTSCSGYRRRDRFDQQQDAIATTLPVAECGWSRWRVAKPQAPRGYAFAAVVLSPAVTANVYAVHLKSNYGATTAEAKKDNRAKRTAAIRQIVGMEKGAIAFVAGDFNADPWRKEFSDETIFATLADAGFVNPLEDLPPDRRGTHPSRTHGDSALDFIFTRGMKAVEAPRIIPTDGLSDHCAVFIRF